MNDNTLNGYKITFKEEKEKTGITLNMLIQF